MVNVKTNNNPINTHRAKVVKAHTTETSDFFYKIFK